MIGSIYSGTGVGVGEGVSVGEGDGEGVGLGEGVGSDEEAAIVASEDVEACVAAEDEVPEEEAMPVESFTVQDVPISMDKTTVSIPILLLLEIALNI